VSRPGRGVVNEETCPIVRARGCSAGFIGTGFLWAAPPKFPAGPIRSRPWRLGPQPGAYKYGAHFVNRHSGSDREGGCNKKTLNHFELLLPRGPCVGTIAQPPLASHKNLTSSSSTNRGVPVLAPSTSHPSYQPPSTRGPCAGTIVQPPLV
jgi:hypothetical protein